MAADALSLTCSGPFSFLLFLLFFFFSFLWVLALELVCSVASAVAVSGPGCWEGVLALCDCPSFLSVLVACSVLSEPWCISLSALSASLLLGGGLVSVGNPVLSASLRHFKRASSLLEEN